MQAVSLTPSRRGCCTARREDKLSRIGKAKWTVSCLKFKTVADLNLDVLEEVLVEALAELRATHKCTNT